MNRIPKIIGKKFKHKNNSLLCNRIDFRTKQIISPFFFYLTITFWISLIPIFTYAQKQNETTNKMKASSLTRINSGANFVHYKLGELEIYSLSDGYIDMPVSRLRQQNGMPFNEIPEQIELVNGKLRLSVNTYLIIDKDEYILIDTGAGSSWEPTMGKLIKSLEEAGISRDKITKIAITHTHQDHANGLVIANGEVTFPKLRHLFVPKNELHLFDNIKSLSCFKQIRKGIENGDKIGTNVTAFSAFGHEIGHTAYIVSSKGNTLIIWGDIVHVQSIQFQRPELTWEFDNDQAQARSTRKLMLDKATQPNVFVAGAHLSYPGVGKITKKDTIYKFDPL